MSTGSTTFGGLLRRHRFAVGLTQEGLAQRAGLSPKAISDLERDPGRSPRLGTVGLLADALSLAPDVRAELLAAARPSAAADDQGSRAASSASVGPGPLTQSFVPRPLSRLVGRSGVAAAVAELLRRGESRLLTLTGPGGVGKTRLALEVAQRVAADFPEGVAFVDLTPLRDPALVVDAVAQRLGVDDRDATPSRDRLAVALGDRRMLLVLDNLEHVLAAGGDVIAVLEACPRVVVLATSRVAPGLRGARQYRIAPLTTAEAPGTPEELAQAPAVELFIERSRAAGADLSLDSSTLVAVGEICRRLEGLPLAIELAAARVPLLAPPALLARLDKRLPLLVGGAHDLPARQRTMHDAIAWSYELLDDAHKTLLERLCVFVGGCTLDAAEAVCARETMASSVLDGVAVLVDSSLLRVEQTPVGPDADVSQATPRLAMLETVREFGLDQLEAGSEAGTARQRHADWCLAVAEQAASELGGVDTAAWLARLDQEHDNLRAALRWAHEHDHGATLLRMAAALWPFWQQQGHLTEGRGWLQAALDVTDDDVGVEGPVRIHALVGAARLAIGQAAHDEAASYCAAAVALAGAHGLPADLAAALNTQGLLAREQDRYIDAVHDHEAALAVARQGDDQTGEATALLGLAYAAMFTGDSVRASALAEEALHVARQTQDRRLLSETLFLPAWLALNAGAYEPAQRLGTEALELARALRHTGEVAEALFHLANVALCRGRYQDAAQHFSDSLTLNQTRGDAHRLSRDLAGLGAALLNLGDLPDARAHVEESLTLARGQKDRWSCAMSLTMLGHVDLADEAIADAHEHLTEAATVFLAIGNLMYLPWCLEGLAAVAVAVGDITLAATLEGTQQAVRARTGVSTPPIHPIAYAGVAAAVHDALTPNELAAATETGARQPLTEAIAALTGRHKA